MDVAEGGVNLLVGLLRYFATSQHIVVRLSTQTVVVVLFVQR